MIRNSIRYAPAGSAVEVELTGSPDAARVSVRDYGPGVPEESLPKIFQPFFRVDDSRESSTGGVALPLLVAADTRGSCLALCRYVDAHRAIWSALLTGGAAGAMREEFLRQAMHLGSVQVQRSSWLPVELGAIYGVGATVEILAWWLRQPRDFTVERIAEIIDRLVVTPAVGRNRTRAEPRTRPRRPRRRKSGRES